jgi:type II secretory pathway pseudopilin PulG
VTKLRAISAYVLPRRRLLRHGIALNATGRERLLESLCVVAIVALLLGFALESYIPMLKRFMLTEAANMTAGYRVEIATAIAVQGVLPQALTTSDSDKQPVSRYFDGMTWYDGEIIFALGAETAIGMLPEAELAGVLPLTLSYRVARTATGGRLALICGLAEPPPGFTAAPARYTTVPAEFLPTHCRI